MKLAGIVVTTIVALIAVAIAPTAVTAASWSVKATEAPPEGAQESSLSSVSCPSSTACTAVGWYRDTKGKKRALIERWNGTSWSKQELPQPIVEEEETEKKGGKEAKPTFLYRVSCASAIDCVAVGGYIDSLGNTVTLAFGWDGTEWIIQPTPNPESASSALLLGVSCPSTTACVAVGWYEAKFVTKTLVEQWNGSSWSIQEPPNPSGASTSLMGGVSCTSPTACTAVGRFVQSGTEKPLAEIWNGSAWSLQEPSIPVEAKLATNLNGVSCISATACMAAGQFYNGSANKALTESWNGSSWSILTTPNPAGAVSVLYGISCVTEGSACIAVGRRNSTVPLAEAWNGSSWTIQEPAVPSGAKGETVFSGVSCISANECMAVGSFLDNSGTRVTLAEQYK